MARIFITGSADGLGHLTAKLLIKQGHEVLLHARSEQRGQQAMEKLPGAIGVATGDLQSIDQMKELASQVDAQGIFDVVIHNAGVYTVPPKEIFMVNTIAPYVLTCLIQKPKRLIYLSSDMHMQGKFHEDDFKKHSTSYSDSKLHVVMLSKAVSRKWTDVYSNAVNPGWVPTKMGGSGAPDDLQLGYETQVWLADSNDAKAKVSGRYFFHQKEVRSNPQGDNTELQDKLLELCHEITGFGLPF